jgi:HEAT repeat protein
MTLFQYSIPTLTDALQYGDGMVEGLYHAADVISQYCTPRDTWAIEPLLSALRHESDARPVGIHAASIIDALGVVGDERAVQPLIAQLAQDDRAVGEKAAGVLGELGDPRSIEPLRAALERRSGAAAHALAAFRDHESAPRILEIGKGLLSSIRAGAISEEMGRSDADRSELESLDLLEWEQDRVFAEKQFAADLILALGKLGAASAKAPLGQQLRDHAADPEICVPIAISLLRLSDSRGRGLVVDAAFDSMSNWSTQAARCLVEMNDPLGLEARQEWYRAEDIDGRNAIVKWFSRYGDQRDIPFLQWILRIDKSMTSFGWTILEVAEHAISRVQARMEAGRLSVS